MTADWLHMGAELSRLEGAAADFVHVDVMDGHFCPQLTVGPSVVAGLRTSLRKDVHLMIEEPLDMITAFAEAGADVITFHVESTRHPHRVLQAIGALSGSSARPRPITRGVAINPGTSVTALEPLLDDADLVLILAVDPGWGGQAFAPGTARRLDAVRGMIQASGRKVLLAVDGGVTRQNAGAIAAMGVDVIVAGSAVFDGGDPVANLRHLQRAVAGAESR